MSPSLPFTFIVPAFRTAQLTRPPRNSICMTHAPIARRPFLQTLIALTVPLPTLAQQSLSLYKGPLSLGFTFSYPSEWTVQKKPIRTHLSEINVTNPSDKSVTAGVVVDAVKIPSIDKFGSVETVADRVVQVERNKESVKQANVLSCREERKNGLLYYIIEYIVDSSRGEKRYLAKATVVGAQLYVITAQAKVAQWNDVQDELTNLVDSFGVDGTYL